MALIAQEAGRLNLPKLKTRIIATGLKRGPALMTSRLPCVFDEADTLKTLYEDNTEVGTSLADPRPADVTGFSTLLVSESPNKSRESIEFFTGWKMMQRYADVHEAHTYDQRFFNRQQVEINKQYQYLLLEWNDYMLNGLGHNRLAFNGIEFYLDYIASNFRPEVKQWATSDGTATGVPQPLSLPDVRKLITTVVCGAYDAIITDLDSFNALMVLIESASGNTAPMLMAENFGVPVMSNGQYAGVPIIVSDFVGRPKSHAAATANGTVLTVPTNDLGWIGFSDLDIGRTIRVAGADFGATIAHPALEETEIVDVTDPYTVVLADAAAAAVTGALTSDQQNAMYAVRFSEDDGFHFRHPTPNGSVPDSVYPCLPAVCGLQEIMLGHLQTCPQVHRTVIQLRGQFQNESVYSLARLTGYDVLT